MVERNGSSICALIKEVRFAYHRNKVKCNNDYLVALAL
jgi:hypothetical protein